MSAENLPAYVREVESRADARKSARVRWVWADTRVLGPLLLKAQVRVHLFSVLPQPTPAGMFVIRRCLS